VQALLAPDEAALMLVPAERGTHIMVVTREGLVWHRSDWNADRVNKAVRRLRWFLRAGEATEAEAREWTALVDGGEAGFDRDMAFALYQELIAPIRAKLAGKRHLLVAASGSLSSLPLGLLVTRPPTGRDDDPAALRSTPWLIDEFALSQIPSLQSLAFLRKMGSAEGGTPRNRFIGFGNPALEGEAQTRGSRTITRSMIGAPVRQPSEAGGQGLDLSQLRALARLPGTEAELVSLAKALEAPAAALRLGKDNTEEAFRGADFARVGVLALATHALVAYELPGAAEPGLVFTPPDEAVGGMDGYLTASEVAGMRIGADWVLLSACNTAAGDGSEGAPGLSGLARAFFYAGAQTLLASHWPVRDDVAPAITSRAVQLAEQGGSSRAEAFQRALYEVRNKSEHDRKDQQGASLTWAHPAAWAPFTLIGDGAVKRSQPLPEAIACRARIVAADPEEDKSPLPSIRK
jgi:CHAT domain-containing protein